MLGRVLLCGAMFVAPLAHADFYMGGQLSYGSVKTDSYGTDSEGETVTYSFSAEPLTALVQAGYYFSDFTAAELRFGAGLMEDSGVKMSSLWGGYAKFNFPMTNRVALYFLGGYSWSKLGLESAVEQSESGFSGGVGAHLAFNRKWAATVEYMSYIRNSSSTVDGVSLALQYKF